MKTGAEWFFEFQLFEKDSEAQFGEYPWQAAILEQRLIAGQWVFKFVCGASLIWTSVVVTAAHCVQGYVPKLKLAKLFY